MEYAIAIMWDFEKETQEKSIWKITNELEFYNGMRKSPFDGLYRSFPSRTPVEMIMIIKSAAEKFPYFHEVIKGIRLVTIADEFDMRPVLIHDNVKQNRSKKDTYQC